MFDDAQIGFGHAEAAVGDLDDQSAVAGVHCRHAHVGGRRRVPQRVVEQFGEQMDEVARDDAADLALGNGRR